jgi:hypothetical protein
MQSTAQEIVLVALDRNARPPTATRRQPPATSIITHPSWAWGYSSCCRLSTDRVRSMYRLQLGPYREGGRPAMTKAGLTRASPHSTARQDNHLATTATLLTRIRRVWSFNSSSGPSRASHQDANQNQDLPLTGAWRDQPNKAHSKTATLRPRPVRSRKDLRAWHLFKVLWSSERWFTWGVPLDFRQSKYPRRVHLALRRFESRLVHLALPPVQSFQGGW